LYINKNSSSTKLNITEELDSENEEKSDNR
jgi:hypothetical protein